MKRNHGTGQPSNLCVTNKNSGKMDCRKLEIPEMLTGKKIQFTNFLHALYLLGNEIKLCH